MAQISDAWKLCDRLSVIQASLLIAGYDPIDQQRMHLSDMDKALSHFLAIKTALLAAIDERSGFGERVYVASGYDDEKQYLDLELSYVRVEHLKAFLTEKGVRDGFFFPLEGNHADYLDPAHSRYAPKLAAAVRAWEALDNAATLAGKSPKKALEKWLRENAADFGLTSEEDGVVNESAIEAIARISNWRPQGGAPSTLVEDTLNNARLHEEPVLQISPPCSVEPEAIEDIDEIPF